MPVINFDDAEYWAGCYWPVQIGIDCKQGNENNN